jgi:hypothetical protein
MMARTAAAVVLTLAVSAMACGRIKTPPRGGAPELELIKAAAALDVGKVKQLLASGAGTNGLVPFDRSEHSPWHYALTQLRPRKPETIAIAVLMINAGADPNAAWGGNYSDIRAAHIDEHLPIEMLMIHPVPEVARALVGAGMDVRLAGDALSMAVEAQEDAIVHILVDAGANVNANHMAVTPLVGAVNRRDYALMLYLEQHGAREKP